LSSGNIKKTPFSPCHAARGGRIVPFAGYEMPVQYSGIQSEHMAVRRDVGMFDLSHMGEFFVRGKDAFDFLDRMTTNDLSTIGVGEAQYTCMCYPHGGIVDDLLVYRFDDCFMLVVNASNIEKDWEWLNSHVEDSEDVVLENGSDATALLAVQGPASQEVLLSVSDEDLDAIHFYSFIEGRVCGREMVISRTGYTGEDGFELYMSPDDAVFIWEQVENAGKDFGIKPVGLGARDTLRLEMKYALYGNDIDDTTNPLEAGLGWIVKLKKGDFLGRNALLEAKAAGLSRRLIGLVLEGRRIARKGFTVYLDGEPVGEVRSGTLSPVSGKSIATAYVEWKYRKSGTDLEVDFRGKRVPAVVVKTPFYKEGSHR